MAIVVPRYIIAIDIVFVIFAICSLFKELCKKSKIKRLHESKRIVYILRILSFIYHLFIIVVFLLYIKVTTRSKWTRCFLYFFTTLTANFFALQTVYYGTRILFGNNKYVDILFFTSFSSNIIVFIGFWGVIFPAGIFYFGEKFSLIRALQELILHGSNYIVPLIEFYYESKYMYFSKSFLYLLLFLFSSYCLAMSAIYNFNIIDWGVYMFLPWTLIGKIGILTICYLSYFSIKHLPGEGCAPHRRFI
jgi:hypothetical protein